jgi:PGF-CTERM protein
MKSMTKLMVVAMLLVAALVVAPAAAREINSSGAIIYVGEEGLSFGTDFNATVSDPTNITKLVHFTDQTADKTIYIDGSNFELKKSEVGTTTGAYHVFTTGTEKAEAVGTVEIQIPRVDLDVRLYQDGKNYSDLKDSVDGKSVTRKEKLVFRVDTNLQNGFKNVGDAPTINIDVTLPGGGVTNEFRNAKLKDLKINESPTFYAPDGKGDNPVSINLSGIAGMSDAAAGTYTAQAKWPKAAGFYGKGFDSNTVTFEVLTKALAISSDKDSVVRGNSFTVTITGESLEKYRLYIKPTGDLAPSKYPQIVDGQKGLQGAYNESLPPHYYDIDITNPIDMVIETTAGGTRSIQFDTNTNTDDRQYTIRVEELKATDRDYDEVKVRVEEGDVTITASGTGTYYMGEEITLSGTCTEGDTVYLFMTGPNLRSEGASILNPAKAEFKAVDVEADDTWSYKWNTGDIEGTLDAGGYTIWAVSEERWKGNLSDVNYATTSVHLNTGYLAATSSGATVAKGDELKITGTAMGDPNEVRIWIFGKNYYGKPGELYVRTETVESDGSFEHTLKSGDTDNLAAGQYFVIIQHPMGDKEFGVDVNSSEVGDIKAPGMNAFKITGLQASDAASAVINALDSVNVDDTYVKLTFNVQEAYITIDPIGIKEAGSKFTITGTTNVAVGDKLIVDVTSAAFGPTKKTEPSGFGAVSGTAIVEKGDGVNKWSYEVDAADFKPDQYIVKVECIETDTTTTAEFNLVEKDETTPTAEVTTTAPAGEVTTTVPAGEETTEPTPTPGFGALVALAGLGAVAFLVLRRD